MALWTFGAGVRDGTIQAEVDFRRLVDSAPDLIFRYRVQPTAGFDYVNAASISLTGYTPEEHYKDPDLGLKVVHPDDRTRMRDFLRRLADDDLPGSPILLRGIHKDRSIVWCELHAVALRDDSGRLTAVEGVVRDVTARHAVEEERDGLRAMLGERAKELTALQQAGRALEDDRRPLQDVLRDVAALLPAAYQYSGAEARVAFARDAAATRGFVTTPWLQQVTFRTRSGRSGAIEVAYDPERLPHASGPTPFLAEELTLLEAIADMLRAHVERREVAAELQASRGRLQHLLTASAAVIYTTEPEPPYRTTFISANVEALTGHTVSAFLSDSMFWTTGVHPDDELLFREGNARLCDEGRAVMEYRFRHADGTYHWTRDEVCVTRDATGRPVEHVGYWIDISDRKQVEETVARSERHFRELIENATDMVATLDLSGEVTYQSPSFERVLGYAPGELAGQSAFSLLHPEDRDGVLATIRDGLTCGGGRRGEFRFRQKDGSWRWLESHGAPLTNDRGENVGLIVNSRDITDRKAAELALESEYGFRKAVEDSVLAGLVATDEEGRIAYVNRAFCEMTGFSEDEVLGHLPPYPYWPPEGREARGQFVDSLLADGATRRQYEGPIVKRTGERFDALVMASPLRVGATRGALAAISDITDRNRLETQFHQAQKMEAVGRLAGGVAHDFNNLLTAILGYTELALGSTVETDPLRDDLIEIRKAGESAASLTRQLLAFSRHQIIQPVALDLNAVVTDTTKILRRVIGEDVTLVTGLAPSVQNVRADRGQIEQVLMNLAVNARDAMPRGGALVLQTANQTIRDPQREGMPELEAGDYVVLAVSDTGCGMSPEVLSHLFEPFFTTKERGKGTGLGLATVYGIVHQSAGHVAVRSGVGEGTSVIVHLPVVCDADPEAQVPLPPLARRGRGERVLVVEDHEAIRALALQLLQQGGYHVRAAGTAEEALGIVETDPLPFDLLVTDVVMPGISGPALAERLRARFPALRCLFMSGYTDDALQRHGVPRDVVFLQKPFRPPALLQKVREQLDR